MWPFEESTAAAKGAWQTIVDSGKQWSAEQYVRIAIGCFVIVASYWAVKFGSEKVSNLLKASAELVKQFVPICLCAAFCVWLHARHPLALTPVFSAFDAISVLFR